ncbi:hypothetical protein H1R20_g11171, partial [Candolleomyces eurysporus]
MPSRLLWFLIGAGSASWWMMCKDRDFSRRHWGHCRRVDYPMPVDAEHMNRAPPRDPSNDTAAAPGGPGPYDSGSPQPRRHPWQMKEHWEWRWQQRNRQENNSNGASQWPWDASDERFDEMTKQAGEAMTELTEVTLDTVLTTAQALKVKLAEYRAEKERQQKDLDAKREEARRNPPRLV